MNAICNKVSLCGAHEAQLGTWLDVEKRKRGRARQGAAEERSRRTGPRIQREYRREKQKEKGAGWEQKRSPRAKVIRKSRIISPPLSIRQNNKDSRCGK